MACIPQDPALETTDTLLLAVTSDYSVQIGLPPRHHQDRFRQRAIFLGTVKNVSHLACSPEGELFCILSGDLYRGPMPSKQNVDWFTTARRVGRFDWNRIRRIFFHPNGDCYVTTHDGELYKGPQPDNEHVPWLYDKATKIGKGEWSGYDMVFFDLDGNMYAVGNDKFWGGPPPTNENVSWRNSVTMLGGSGWYRLTHFMGYTPDKKLWAVDKYNGVVYRGDTPTPQKVEYLLHADILGWSYHEYRFLGFIKDKTIKNIISFEFLTDQGKKLSENPEVLEEKIYDNRRSSSTMRHSFKFIKTIKETSYFSHHHGFIFEVEGETSFKTGIPVVAEGSVNVKMNMNTTHNWDFTKNNETEVSFESSTDVELEAGKAIRMVASVVKAEMNVPYKAKARTMFGSVVDVIGMWFGVSHYNLMVTQEDFNR